MGHWPTGAVCLQHLLHLFFCILHSSPSLLVTHTYIQLHSLFCLSFPPSLSSFLSPSLHPSLSPLSLPLSLTPPLPPFFLPQVVGEMLKSAALISTQAEALSTLLSARESGSTHHLFRSEGGGEAGECPGGGSQETSYGGRGRRGGGGGCCKPAIGVPTLH